MKGNMLALTSITLNDNATLLGRALAQSRSPQRASPLDAPPTKGLPRHR
jgi:hypothetical protein